jgi:hypothetical protein
MSPERFRNQHGTNGASVTQGDRYIRMAAEGGTYACGQSRAPNPSVQRTRYVGRPAGSLLREPLNSIR